MSANVSCREDAVSSPQVLQREERNANDIDEDNLPCKWGPLRCCQQFRSIKLVLFLLCCASAIQGMAVNGFVSIIIPNLEKRFDLKSTDSGLIASSYDIAVLLSLIPVTYFGGLGRKPRWLGFGVIFMGLGSFVFAIPHFTTGLYQYQTFTDTDYCDVSRNTSDYCGASGSNLNHYKYVFILGQLMHGVGATPLYSLGVTYLDENLTQKMSSLFIGIYLAMAVGGPAIGFILGGFLLRLYTDFYRVSKDLLLITEDSPSWVGAWWPGFLLSGVLSIITGTLLLGFPKYLPNTAKIRAEKISEVHRGAEGIETIETGISKIKDMPKYIKLLLTNPTLIFLSLAGATEAIVSGGIATFVTKFVQVQFATSSSLAAIVVGVCLIPAGGGGTFVGGYLVKRLSLSLRGTIKLTVICATLALLSISGLLLKCDDAGVAGITTSYNSSETFQKKDLSAACNADCSCPLAFYNPVCGADKTMYFSSCAAGCTNSTMSADGTQMYHGCRCVNDMVANNISSFGTAKSGRCSISCKILPVFACLFTISVFFSYVSFTPAVSASLRSVPEKQKSFALGIQWILIRSLGSIPGPITYGAVVDQTCLFWLNPCGDSQDGACYFYDQAKLGYYLLAVSAAGKIGSILFFSLAGLLYKPPPSTEDERLGDTEQVQDKKNKPFDSIQTANSINHT